MADSSSTHSSTDGEQAVSSSVPGTSSSAASSSSTSQPFNKYSARSDRMKRLKELHLKRNEARKLNHVEVQEEEKRAHLPANHEAKKRRAEWILKEEEERERCAQTGEDFDRAKLLHMQADELERMHNLRAKKKHADPGFSNYENATARQYKRNVSNLKVDMESYEKEKSEIGEEAFYAGRDTLVHGLHKDKPENIDRMVKDLERTVEKRSKFSRRRMHNDEADIDYINERNMKFNKKLERFYGEYTAEIKQNLERGTAI